jgi:LacI family transcriptional regulator, repressor for deo operon, udp, cdd, tsx, nupC, and nupG
MATIRDVAREAGVSTATVSRVLSRPDVVNAETRASVIVAIENLGYTPNAAAKSLRTLRSGKILVTVPDIANPFFSLILQGIESAALRSGYAVLLGDTQHDDSREQQYALMLQRREADGLIFLGHRLPKAAAGIVRSKPRGQVPVVNGCEFSPSLGVPSVHIDNAKAAFEAVDHLCQLGHRRIGVVTGPMASPLSRDRLKGATARADRDRTRVTIAVAGGDFSIESGIAAGDQLLSAARPPTGIFCFNDEMAIGVLHSARQRGLHVPDDLSVIGFDDIRFAQYMDPPLTTIRQPMRELGEATVRLLLNILRGNVKDAVSVTLPHALIVRASTAAPRVRASLTIARG